MNGIYKMDDGTVVKIDNATAHWDERREHDGSNWISAATGSQWTHETLHRSRKGRYWVEHTSQWQGSRDYAEWVGNHTAAQWLIANGHELPADLQPLEVEVSE